MISIYVDETGTTKEQTILTVGGIILDPAVHAQPLRQACLELQQMYYRPHMLAKGNIPFHATDIYTGNRNFNCIDFPDRDERYSLLRDLCSIPARLGLAIVFCDQEKKRLYGAYPHEEVPPQKRTKALERFAFQMATVGIVSDAQAYMQERAPAERAEFIYEDNSETRKLSRLIHKAISDRPLTLYGPGYKQIMGITHLDPSPRFMKKGEDFGTQIADAVIYAINRMILRQENANIFYEPLIGLRVERPKLPPQPLGWDMPRKTPYVRLYGRQYFIPKV